MKDEFSNPELLDTILETIAALVVVMDDEGCVVRFNEACQELTGYSFDEVKGKPIWELLIPDAERDAVIEVFDELRAGNFPNRHENHWQTRDGELRTIDWSNSAIIGDDGQVELVIATGVDVTKQRSAERDERKLIRARAARRAAEAARDSLRLSEEIFSGIVDLCADAIISIDEAQTITLFNQGAEEIFGYTADEVMDKPLSVLLPEKARPSHAAHVREFSHTPNASRRMGERREIFGLRKNGELFPAEASISKQKIDGAWLYTAVVRDVTTEKEAREELRKANQELERSNSDLEHFAAVASHDLQEPLRKIRAFGERLESKYKADLPSRGRDYLERMQNAAGRMSNLIDDLLAFSRVTTRAKPFETMEVADVVQGVVTDLEVRIEQSKGRVDIGDLPRLDADPMQIRLLFQNLIGNALKFHRPDVPPVVEVGTEQCDEDQCVMYVQDNGTGFDEKYLDRIFDVFQRLHGRGTYEGTGMGLAICRKIVERHGGTLDATSIPGEGSRFVVTLPRKQSECQSPDNHAQEDNHEQ